VTFITSGHPVDPAERKLYLTGAPRMVTRMLVGREA
jgi:hypothetical protein